MFASRETFKTGAQQYMSMLRCCAGMLAKKARLLVTNQLQYTREATAIVYLEDGRVAASGTYDQVVSNERFSDMLREYEVRQRLIPAFACFLHSPPAAPRPRARVGSSIEAGFVGCHVQVAVRNAYRSGRVSRERRS